MGGGRGRKQGKDGEMDGGYRGGKAGGREDGGREGYREGTGSLEQGRGGYWEKEREEELEARWWVGRWRDGLRSRENPDMDKLEGGWKDGRQEEGWNCGKRWGGGGGLQGASSWRKYVQDIMGGGQRLRGEMGRNVKWMAARCLSSGSYKCPK